MMENIEEALDRLVRPKLALHGGGIELLEVTGGTLRLRLLGQCANCPSAYLTTEQMIRDELLAALPQLGEVVLVRQVSEDLLAQARALLCRH